MKDGQASLPEDYLMADGNLFDIVQFPLVAGTSLSTAQTAVLSQREAMLRFGTEDVVGKTLSTISRGETARLSRSSA